MSKLNSNEVLYGCHRETPFLLARIHREVRSATAAFLEVVMFQCFCLLTLQQD